MDLISCHDVIGTGEEEGKCDFILQVQAICLLHARKRRSLRLIGAASKYPLPVK